MVAFPLELFRSIVKEIDDNRDLCVLAIVCRALQPEAERVLYRQLIGDGAREVVQVCKRICCSPRFGPYVRYFTADALDDGTFELMAFTRILRSALANLRYLHCHLFTDSQMIPPGAVLNGSLSTLLVFSSYFPIENNLIVFLERQKNLRQFSCWKGPVPEFMAISTPVSNHIMPKLEVLDLRECLDHSNIAIRLLPGRPITHLAVHRVDAMLLQCIALTTLPLQALCIMGDGLRPLSFYRHLSSAIPELAVLRGPSRIAKEEIGVYIDMLSQLKKLREVESLFAEFTDPAAVAARIRAACPSLRKFTLYMNNTWRTYVWKSGCSDGSIVKNECFRDVWSGSVEKIKEQWETF